MSKKTAYEKTIALATELGYGVRSIDDDCIIIRFGDLDVVQMSFDRFSPSFAFVSAQTMSPEPVHFKGYRDLRAWLKSFADYTLMVGAS